MVSELKGRRIAFLVAQEGVEEAELTEPWQAVEEAGATPQPIAPEELHHAEARAHASAQEALRDDAASHRVQRGAAGDPCAGVRPTVESPHGSGRAARGRR